MDRVFNTPFDTSPSTSPDQAQCGSVFRAALIGAATLACLMALGLAVGVFSGADHNGNAQNQAVGQQAPAYDPLSKLGLFPGWQKPTVVLLLSGEQHGYLQPCGCSTPQYGGMARRYNLLQEMKKRGWPIVSADLGDINQKYASNPPQMVNTGPQAILKFTYAMRSLDAMGYAAVGFGDFEMSMPLSETLTNYTLNNPTPVVVSANLLNRGAGQLFNNLVSDLELATPPAAPKVGIFGLTGSSVEQKVKDPFVKFNQNAPKVVEDALAQLSAKGAELFVLLYQGSVEEATACATFVNGKHQQNAAIPRLDVILCLSATSEPPGQPNIVGKTVIVEVGHKGRYVGVVGAFRNGSGFDLKYQLVSIGPEFDTPKGLEQANKVMALMEQYTSDLKAGNYLPKFKQVNHPIQNSYPNAEYVGSDKCMNCHQHAFNVWKHPESKDHHGHSTAYQTLVDAKNPSLRQYDGECIICHTVGFGYKTGYENFGKTKHLTDVGCESCHGPCSEHVSRPNNKALYPLINQYKWQGPQPPNQAQANQRKHLMSDFCQKCHDLDNDNNFNFDVKWAKIIHMTPPAGQPAAGANPAVQNDTKKK